VAVTQHIKSARKTKDGTRPVCCTCHQPIEVGQGYYKNSPSRFSTTFTWHEGCPGPRDSALEANEKRSTAYAACEDAHEAVDAIDGVYKDGESDVTDDQTRARLVMEEVTDIFNALQEGIDAAAEMWRESASNIEDGFGHETEKSQEMNDHADTYESAGQEAADSTDQVTEWDPEAGFTFEEWLDNVRTEAHEAIDNIYGIID
jgi:hypothetical protein